MTDEQRAEFVGRGMGITNLVSRATVRASELSVAELREGGVRLVDVVAEIGPSVVAVAGVTAFRTAFGQPKASLGVQQNAISGVPLWVIPNPSGLNAHETVDSLAYWYRQVGDESGIR